MTLFNQYNQMLMSNQDDALSASTSSNSTLEEDFNSSASSIACYTTSGAAFYYQASKYYEARTARHSAGGDGIINPKTCSFEQAATHSRVIRERNDSKSGRDTLSWYTEKLMIAKSEIVTELFIKEDSKTTMHGVLVESPVGSGEKTVFLAGNTSIELKEALVILLDLCIDCLDCQHLAFVVERAHATNLLNDLKWVGFQLISPDVIVRDKSVLEDYVFMGMDL